MHGLPVIRNICNEVIEAQHEGKEWKASYCCVVNPQVVLGMVAEMEKPPRIIDEELHDLCALVRHLTGYIKRKTSDAPDPVRDDLLLQARQLLGVAGI
jgi:hypothetical protein